MTERDAAREHHEWQRRLQRRLPGLAARTFALRVKAYPGYGFQYALEHTLGSVIRIATTAGSPVNATEREIIAGRIIDHVVVESFHVELMKAERGASE